MFRVEFGLVVGADVQYYWRVKPCQLLPSIVLRPDPCLGKNASTGRYCIYSGPILDLFKHNTGLILAQYLDFFLAQYWTRSGPILVHIKIHLTANSKRCLFLVRVTTGLYDWLKATGDGDDRSVFQDLQGHGNSKHNPDTTRYPEPKEHPAGYKHAT